MELSNRASSQCKAGTFSASTSTTSSVSLGFKPKYLAVYGSTKWMPLCIYDETVSTSSYLCASDSSYTSTKTLTCTEKNRLREITSSGFSFNILSASAPYTTVHYFAVG